MRAALHGIPTYGTAIGIAPHSHAQLGYAECNETTKHTAAPHVCKLVTGRRRCLTCPRYVVLSPHLIDQLLHLSFKLRKYVTKLLEIIHFLHKTGMAYDVYRTHTQTVD